MNLKRVCISTLILIAVTGSAFAGSQNIKVTANAMLIGLRASQQTEEGDAYKAWYDANAAGDLEKAYPMAKAFIEKYPSNQYSKYLKETWLPGARTNLFNKALGAKNVSDMIQWGNEALTDDPNNVEYLNLLSYGIYNYEIIGKKDFAHGKELTDYNTRLMTQIEAGKIPAGFAKDASWKKNVFLGALNQQLGVVASQKGDDAAALEAYQKASALDPKNSYNYLQIGYITYKTKYKPAADKFGAFPPEKKNAAEPEPEVKAALDDLNAQTDKVIDNWAHYIALESSPDASVKDGLANLYKFRHPDTPDDWKKLVDQYKGSPANPKP